MNKLWTRIGLGAGLVFVAGMFVVTLGRQLKASVVGTMETGGRFAVPLSLLPFEVDNDRVGSIQSVDVQKSGRHVKRIEFTVKLSDPDRLASFENCLFALDGPRRDGFFSCIPEGSSEAEDYVTVGEVRIEPNGLVRPLVLSRHDAGDWFDGDNNAEEVNISANEAGAVIKVVDESGNKVVHLTADSQGAVLRVKDANGREVVNMRANANGLDLKVKKDQP
jgi:hypothetical protein